MPCGTTWAIGIIDRHYPAQIETEGRGVMDASEVDTAIAVSFDISLLRRVEDILLSYGRIPGPRLYRMISEREQTLRNIQKQEEATHDEQ
jgi:Cft2 family RNA processing exonuclease